MILLERSGRGKEGALGPYFVCRDKRMRTNIFQLGIRGDTEHLLASSGCFFSRDITTHAILRHSKQYMPLPHHKSKERKYSLMHVGFSSAAIMCGLSFSVM